MLHDGPGQRAWQPEGVATQHQGQSLSDIVTSAYTDILHRAPDAGGLNYWVQQLQSGLPLELFPLSFIMGARGADSHEVATQETIGAQFAIEQGLTDVAQAKAVFAPFATPPTNAARIATRAAPAVISIVTLRPFNNTGAARTIVSMVL